MNTAVSYIFILRNAITIIAIGKSVVKALHLFVVYSLMIYAFGLYYSNFFLRPYCKRVLGILHEEVSQQNAAVKPRGKKLPPSFFRSGVLTTGKQNI